MTSSAPVALVTGASRGIGAAVARLLAQAGYDLIINYRSKGSRAEAVVADIRALGQRALAVQADLTLPADRERLAAAATVLAAPISLLVLNASGGLEKDKPAAYAMDLNYTAQLETVRASLPYMSTASTLLFVTSHWAHFYGQAPVMPAYELVARSKKAGEDGLRAQQHDLAQRGIRLLVVSGDVIEGTITPKLLNRVQPGAIEERRVQAGSLPTVAEFAQAIVDTALNRELASGATIYVGATT